MRTYAFVLSIALVFQSFGSPAVAAGKRVALVVGINTYDNLGKDQQLQRAINDVRALGEALKPLGFEVIPVEDVGRSAFNRQWQSFLNKIGPEDTAAVFFSGHGVEVNGLNYLLPRDIPNIRGGEEELLRRESLGVADLIADLRDRNPQMSLLVLDACRDNPFKRPGTRSIGGTRGLAAVQPAEGAFVMYSAGTGETALDRLSDKDPVPTSVYMRHLVPLLSKSGLSLSDIAQEVRREVNQTAKKVNHKQTPAYYDEVIGRFCLAGCQTQIAQGAKVDEEGKPTPQPAPELKVASAARAIKLDPKDAEAYYSRANALRDKNDYDGAIADYTAALKLDFSHVRALAARGRVYTQKKEYDKAIVDLTNAIGFDPRDVRLLNSRGIAYGEKRDNAHALADFTESVRLDPKYAIGYHNRGRILAFRYRKYDEGLSDFLESIRLNPKYVSSFSNRGYVYIEKGDFDSAMTEFGQALKLDPKYKYAITGRGDVYARKHELDKALAEYNTALGIDPTYTYALNSRASAYLQKNSFDQALADYSEIIRLEPKNAAPLVARGKAYLRKNDYDRALADYNAALRAEPASAGILRLRGYVYLEKGDKQHALADLNEAVKIAPTSAGALNDRAWIVLKTGEPARALPDAEKAIELSPKYAAAYDTRAHIYEATGRKDAAIADFRKALELSPGLETSVSGLKRLTAVQ